MRLFLVGLLVLLVLFLVGCAGSPLHVSLSGDYAKFDDDELCMAYAMTRKKELKEELKKRGNVGLWDFIDRGVIRVGMTYTEMLCAAGKPYRTNRSIHGDQHIYYLYTFLNSKPWYVYTRRGRVTGVQW